MSGVDWNARYAGDGFAYGTDPNSFLAGHVSLLPAGPVLSLGEGEGRNAVWLAQLGFNVTAVDQSPVGLEKAERLAASRGVAIKTVVTDIATFDLGIEKWGTILSIWCHLPSAIRRRLHASAIRALVPGGVLILEAYTPEQLRYNTGGPRDADWLVTLEELRADFVGLELVFAHEIIRDVKEGMYHRGGESAVVQILARRS